MDPEGILLALPLLFIEEIEVAGHLVLGKGAFDQLGGFRVLLLPVQLVPAFHPGVGVKEDKPFAVIDIGVARRHPGGMNLLDGQLSDFGIPAQLVVVVSLFACQQKGQLPGHVFGLVPHHVFAHGGEDLLRDAAVGSRHVIGRGVGQGQGAAGQSLHEAVEDGPHAH